MIEFHPLDIGIPFDCARSDLVSFSWQDMAADFIIPDDAAKLLRVSFEGEAIVRILDEFPLSTESDPSAWRGHIPHHFAYRIEGAAFKDQQSFTWLEVAGPIKHFQFLTSNGCVDVLTNAEPQFSFIPAMQEVSDSRS